MLSPSPGDYPHSLRSFHERSELQQRPTVDPRFLDWRTMPGSIPPAFHTRDYFHFEDVPPVPCSPHPPHPIYIGGGDEVRQSSEPFHHIPPNYPPHQSASWQGQDSLPLNEDEYLHVDSLPPAQPFTPVYPASSTIIWADEVGTVEVPRCLSPIRLEIAAYPWHLLRKTPLGHQTQPSASSSSSSRSIQTSVDNTTASSLYGSLPLAFNSTLPHLPFQVCDEAHSPPGTVDPGNLHFPTVGIPKAYLPAGTLFAEREYPGSAPRLLTQGVEEGQQAWPAPVDLPHDAAPTHSWNVALQPRGSSSPGPSLQIQQGVWPDRHQYDLSTSIHATGPPSVFSDRPLCSSPTYDFPKSLPPDSDAFPYNNVMYQTPSSSSSSQTTHTSSFQASFEDTLATDVRTIGVPQPTTFHAQPPVGNVCVLPQQRYKERRSSRMLSGVAPQAIGFGPHGYPVSYVYKGKTLKDLPNAKQRAFPGVRVGQKLSWRFLFEGSIQFERQFNVLDAKKNQPTVERIIFETVKALKCFKEQEPRFAYPLDRLVILEIELVAHASVQAKIGVLQDVGAANQG